MSDKASSEYRGEAAAAAFEQVLQAERAAEAAVAACREQAATLLAEAAEGRRRLREEVDARIAAGRLRLTRKADQRVAALEQEAADLAEPPALDAAAMARIGRAVALLADELIEGD